MKCRRKDQDLPWWEAIFIATDDKKKPEVEYTAGPGTHKISFKGRTIYAHHEMKETIITGWERVPEDQEFIHLIAWG